MNGPPPGADTGHEGTARLVASLVGHKIIAAKWDFDLYEYALFWLDDGRIIEFHGHDDGSAVVEDVTDDLDAAGADTGHDEGTTS